MIEKHIYYTVRCDKCNKQYSIFQMGKNENTIIRFSDRKIAKEVIETDGWINMNGSFYCKDCVEKIKNSIY